MLTKRKYRLYVTRDDYNRYKELLCSVVSRCEGDRCYIDDTLPELIISVIRAFMLGGNVSFRKEVIK